MSCNSVKPSNRSAGINIKVEITQYLLRLASCSGSLRWWAWVVGSSAQKASHVVEIGEPLCMVQGIFGLDRFCGVLSSGANRFISSLAPCSTWYDATARLSTGIGQ